jgi:hypothetical protein
MAGFVKTSDIKLWDKNERLDIHIGQFMQKNGREPDSDELLQIMLSEMSLPGVESGDQFKIEELARSIAVNGVRVPPIIDREGMLLDGNRRVAACYYILNSKEFDIDSKKRVEYLYVWQLAEHAGPAERDAVVVSLNFESDCKLDWPEYVKARKVAEEWQSMLDTMHPRTPRPSESREMKKELSRKFALGPDAAVVSRYLRMVEWADKFEHYLVETQHRDEFEVKHKADKYFQYFDELSKGASPGTVSYTLNEDDSFRHLVFELLFQDKFKNFTLIRNLRYLDQDMRDALTDALGDPNPEHARDHVEDALSDAKNRRREARVVGANERIRVFVKWLKDLPVSAFQEDIKIDNLYALRDALHLVEHEVIPAIKLKDKVAGS